MEKVDIHKEIKKIRKKCNIPDIENISVRYYDAGKLKYIITENKRMGEYYLYNFTTGEQIDKNNIPRFTELKEKGFE